MTDKSIGGGTNTNDNVSPQSNPEATEKPLGINDIDMRAGKYEASNHNKSETNLPAGFNHIEISTVNRVADKDGFISKESLRDAAKDPTLDKFQKDDVRHMLNNFQLLSDVVDDKDGGKKGISREDIAKYNFPHEINYIETSSIAKLTKAKDGSITRDALEQGLKRKDLSDSERDDLEYLQQQFNNIKGFAQEGAKQGVGISAADIAEFNKRGDYDSYPRSRREEYRYQSDRSDYRDQYDYRGQSDYRDQYDYRGRSEFPRDRYGYQRDQYESRNTGRSKE